MTNGLQTLDDKVDSNHLLCQTRMDESASRVQDRLVTLENQMKEVIDKIRQMDEIIKNAQQA